MKRIFLTVALAVCTLGQVSAQKPAASHDGGISPEMLSQISATYEDNIYDKAISNALAGTSIATLAINADNAAMIDTHFSDRVKTKGITDQKSSGRCWLFTGLNVLRAKMIDKYDLPGKGLLFRADHRRKDSSERTPFLEGHTCQSSWPSRHSDL